MNPTYEYLMYCGAAGLLAVVTILLGRFWKRAFQSGSKLGYFQNFLFTAMTMTAVGLLWLGRSPKASTENVDVHGQASPSEEAIAVERRAAEEVQLHTKAELERLRQENQRLRKQMEDQELRQELDEGEQHMLETRERLLRRDF